MAVSHDFLLDANFDPLIEGGDFVVGDSDGQHIELIILSAPGNWRQTPLLGFDITRHLNGPGNDRDRFERDLRVQLEKIDGYTVRGIDTSGGYQNLEVDAYRK